MLKDSAENILGHVLCVSAYVTSKLYVIVFLLPCIGLYLLIIYTLYRSCDGSDSAHGDKNGK